MQWRFKKFHSQSKHWLSKGVKAIIFQLIVGFPRVEFLMMIRMMMVAVVIELVMLNMIPVMIMMTWRRIVGST